MDKTTASESPEDKQAHVSNNPPIQHDEQQYLNAIRQILSDGARKQDRTGTGTYSKFGMQFRYSLSESTMPLLTTKRVYWRGVVEELLWFLRGSTNANELSARQVKIWDANGSRSFLDSVGLAHREQGDLGPIYGFQWRHFGASYSDMHADYDACGVDQVRQVIEQIRTDPDSRRMILSAWNPAALHEMALPPCHLLAQFYVAAGRLSCQMYQRSADMGLGVPFNIASYSLLTHMLAHVCGLEAGEFIHTLGDAHVYVNHVEPLRRQLERRPRAFPKLLIKRQLTNVDEFEASDFELVGYDPHPKIAMPFSA